MQVGRRRRNVFYAILLAALLAIIFVSYQSFNTAGAHPQKPLSDLLTALDQKQVIRGTFNSGQELVDWTDSAGNQYRTFYPTGYEATLVDKFHGNQVSFDVAQSAGSNVLLAVILPNVILILVIGGFMLYVLRRYSGTRPPTA
jgi:ATP-dependent Zn protease